jgi:MinD superfamily P-loop ATPase
MKELVIISGKGGTGKTSIAAAFASLAEDAVLCDADVDAADLHLLMSPEIQQQTEFQGGGIAIINHEKCTECGLCMDLCRFGAVKDNFEIDEIECEGCGVCVDFCPEKAIDFPIKTCGKWFISDTRFGPMVHARLGIAEENSGKLVTLVRQQAKKVAEEKELELIITDGPPGVGCPVIASIGGATALVIIAEPTVSGMHDMERVAQLAEHFKVPCMLCINKYDLNPEKADAIERLGKEMNLNNIGRIPFDPVFTKSMIEAKNIIEYDSTSKTGQKVKKIWKRIVASLQHL